MCFFAVPSIHAIYSDELDTKISFSAVDSRTQQEHSGLVIKKGKTFFYFVPLMEIKGSLLHELTREVFVFPYSFSFSSNISAY